MISKIGFSLFVLFATIVGLYPILYFVVDRNFGLLQSKDDVLLQDFFWNIGFYTHIVFGGLALLIGWSQFVERWRRVKPKVRRQIGKFYIAFVMLSSVSSIFIGFNATGGLVSALGFISLGVIWFATTLKAYQYARSGNFESHKKMMVYSYAACFAAVTLRIWLPLLIMYFGDFIPAYKVVAWLCWVPNLGVAFLINSHVFNSEVDFTDGVSHRFR